jgi:myo-inositol 2-dehydrogenase / D-chiro-inositol 1-dehydrogenase
MNLRAAVVGAGRMGRERARAAKLLGAQIEAICDPDVERAALLAADVDAIVLPTAADLDLSRLDVLFVCTPPALRGATEGAAIAAGVSLFLEKPIGLNAEQCLDLLRALEERPIINAVGYMNRYRDSVLCARQQIQAAFPIAIAFQWFSARYGVPWWLDLNQSGGPVNEQCTHYIDLCRFFCGEISEAQALVRPLIGATGAEGTVAINLRLENGLIGSGLYSCEASHKQMAFEVFLPDRSVRLEGWDLRMTEEARTEDIFVKEVSAFFKAVQSGDASTIQSDIASALKTQSVVDAVRRAMKSGLPERVFDPLEVLLYR